METVLAGVLWVLLFALWWVKKGEPEGRALTPRSAAEGVPPAVDGVRFDAGFRPDIEGLRAIAVLLVLLYHAEIPLFGGGFVGVDVFFVLSGFLITSLLLRELGRTGTVSLSNFWARRARRLLPASGLVLLVTLLASRFMLDGLSQGELARDAIAASAFVVNIRFMAAGTDYLTSQLPPSPLLHFWSLAVEEQFYLVWPGLLLLLVRVMRLSRRTLGWVIGVGWLASFAACVMLTDTSQPWAFFMLPTRAWELLTGAALALGGGVLLRIARPQRALLGWVGVMGIVVVALWFDDSMHFPGWIAVLPVVATVLVINAGGSGVPNGPVRLLAAQPLQWVGARSYAIYLWHFPLLVLCERKWGPLSYPTRLSLLVLSVLLAAVSYHLLENPVRHSPLLSAVPARSLLMGAVVVLLGVGAGAVLLKNPPRLDAGGEVAVPTLAPQTSPPPTAPTQSTAAAADSSTTSTTVAAPPPADASRDNPPALAAMIEANRALLEQSAQTQKVPSNLSPGLRNARDDLPQIYRNKCILDVGVSQPKDCIYGDANGSVDIVLFGDSHAAQWMPALHQVASQNGWRLIVHVKKACPTAEIPTDKDPNRTDCVPWRQAVIDRIAALQPDLVIMSAYRYKQVGAAAGRDPDQVWREGLDLTLQKMQGGAQRILLLGDSATPADDVPSCVAGRLSNVGSCMNSRDNAVRPGRLGVERELAAQYGVSFVPTSDWMCTDSVCPVIVGNVLMYRDNSHITATASAFLAP
ncbi:MAG: acyltransferase family protein, partial [Acidobacteria bacterium]|nr:acyltransferase family protein [Acidobacteriota bacterium]